MVLLLWGNTCRVVSSSKLCVDVEDTVRCVTLLKGQQCSKGYTGTPPYCTGKYNTIISSRTGIKSAEKSRV